MRICFFGHSSFFEREEIRVRLELILKDYVSQSECEFFFGGYGNFDDMAYSVVAGLRSDFAIKKAFVTPYITESYSKNHLEYRKNLFDVIIYPELERVPYRFAISARNKWMVEQSDVVIGYVRQE